jgi:hypothetical protein
MQLKLALQDFGFMVALVVTECKRENTYNIMPAYY